ncbi:tripartite motif-containing protein 16-like protein [Engraulis encrasicolus]|uniref:tripartite motif-containing protein 16-like protein n=1 Tax=Engraulis encrasicolus TaxID=184585 RepID=UPI002FD66C1F
MAKAHLSVCEDEFSCPVCLDVLKNPVTIPCGHSFCMECITSCWDEEDLKGVYSCPQCRQTFTPRPVLFKNTLLANMVEMFKKSGIESHCPTLTYAEPGIVECDVCTGRKQKAIKSCLVCLSSYCETHFKAHNDLFPGKKHNVIEADGKLKDLICSQHDKLLDVFCRTDQTCICVLCVMDEHSEHKTVSVAAERTEKQKELGQLQMKNQHTIQEKQKHLEELREAMRVMKKSAQAAVEDSEGIFAEMIHSIKRRCSEVTKLIRDKEKADVTQAEELMETLEQEIAELKKRDAELEHLSKTHNHTSFLQSCSSMCSLTVQESSTSGTSSDVSFGKVTQSVSQLKDELEDFLKQAACSIIENAELISLFQPREPLTRGDFLKYSYRLHLDPITANKYLHLSGGNKKVTATAVRQQYPNNPERFDNWQQVLCKESVSGRCYWEVEWAGAQVFVALSSKAITRKGQTGSQFGSNQHSWSLSCSHSSSFFIHNGKETNLNVIPSSTIGVYVDHKAGILSFYSIHGDTMTLLYKIQTTFIQPLYAGFWIGLGSKVHLCN